jgi:hypothetical protein
MARRMPPIIRCTWVLLTRSKVKKPAMTPSATQGQRFQRCGQLACLRKKATPKKSAHSSSGSNAPVDSRAGRALANNATVSTPRPATPVLDRPVVNAPSVSNVHCKAVRFTWAKDACVQPGWQSWARGSGTSLGQGVLHFVPHSSKTPGEVSVKFLLCRGDDCT